MPSFADLTDLPSFIDLIPTDLLPIRRKAWRPEVDADWIEENPPDMTFMSAMTLDTRHLYGIEYEIPPPLQPTCYTNHYAEAMEHQWPLGEPDFTDAAPSNYTQLGDKLIPVQVNVN